MRIEIEQLTNVQELYGEVFITFPLRKRNFKVGDRIHIGSPSLLVTKVIPGHKNKRYTVIAKRA